MANITQDTISLHIKSSADEAANSVKKLSANLKGLKIALGGAGAVAFAKTLKSIGTAIAGYTTKMTDYITTMNRFKTVMGDSTTQAQEFIDQAEKILGLDPTQMMTAFSSFQTLGEGFGIASDEAYLMSKNLTQLTADMSSMLHIPFNEALQKVKSGFAGELEPMRAVGVSLDKATLQQTAYTLGINKKIDAMTRAQKTELIYYQMMNSTTLMQGNLAQTLVSPTNAIRLMQNEFSALARAIGSIFIPMMMNIIPVVRAITELMTEAANAIAKFFGFKLSDYETDTSGVLSDISTGIADVGDSADSTTKKLNKMLMPFDELNNVNFSSATGATTGAATGGSLGITLPKYNMFDNATDKMTENVEQIKEKLRGLIPVIQTVGGILLTAFSVIQIMKFAQWISNVKTALDNLGTIGKLLKGSLGLAFEITGAILIFKGIKKVIDEGLTPTSLLELIGGTGLIAVGAAIQFSSTLPLKIGAEVSVALAAGFLMYKGIKKALKDGLTPESLFEIIAGGLGIAGAITAGVFTFKNKMKLKLNSNIDITDLKTTKNATKEVADAAGTVSKNTETLKTGVNDLLGALGKATEIMAVLGGLAIVIKSVSGLIDSFSQSGLSVQEVFGLVASVIGTVTVAFTVMMGVMKNFEPSWKTIAGAAVVLGGIAAVMLTVSKLIDSISQSGDNLNEVLGALEIVMGTIIASATALVLLGSVLQSPMAMAGVAVVVASISAILIVMSKTLPTILESCAKFINDTAPSTIKLINAISDAVQKIIYALGTTLPPIILSIGSVFNTIFKGIENIVRVVGDTVSGIINSIGGATRSVLEGIKNVIKQIGDSITQVAYTVIWFINNLGPAIENFTNSLIRSITRMVNFVISAIEYLVNRVIDGANALKDALNSVLGKVGFNIKKSNYIYIPRFSGYKDGGLPEKGEMFFANEDGPELIGNIGRRAAVANNDQIIEGISEGTYSAVSRAMLENRNSNTTQRSPYFVINLGNESLYKGYAKFKAEESNMYGVDIG